MAMPGMPGMDEFLSLAMQARILSMSGAAPAHVRNHPHIAFHVAMIGRDLGISPTAAIQLIDVIGRDDDPNPQLSLSPELLNGQIRRLGLGAIRPLKRTMFECIAGAYGPDGELLGESEFDWADAVVAGLADDRCQPNQHWVPTSGNGRCRCRQGYRTYPKRMLWWRASGFAAQDYFPEAGLGLYSPEALGAVVGPDGRPIDPTQVELPDGYGPGPGHGNGQARGLPVDTRADGAELWQLQARAWALPDEFKRQLRQRREQTPALRTDGGVIPLWQLPDRGLRIAKSLLAGLESQAERGDDGWDRAEALDAVHRHLAHIFTVGLLAAFEHLSPTDAQDASTDTRHPQDQAAAGDAPTATQAPLSEDERKAALVTPEIIEWIKTLPGSEVETLLDQAKVDWAGKTDPEKRMLLALEEADARAGEP